MQKFIRAFSVFAVLMLLGAAAAPQLPAAAQGDGDDETPALTETSTFQYELVGAVSLSYPADWFAEYVDDFTGIGIYVGNNPEFLDAFQTTQLGEDVGLEGAAANITFIPVDEFAAFSEDTSALGVYELLVESLTNTDGGLSPVEVSEPEEFEADNYDDALRATITAASGEGAVYVFANDEIIALIAANITNSTDGAILDAVLATLLVEPFDFGAASILVCDAADADCYDEFLVAEQGFTADGFATIGSADAPVIIAEFSDFACPACASYAPTYRELVGVYAGDQAQFWYVPLTFVGGELSELAYQAAYCAGEQDAFWQFHEEVFQLQEQLSREAFTTDEFSGIATEMGLDLEAFAACLDDERSLSALAPARDLADAVGVSGTPTVAFSTDGGDTWAVIQQRDFAGVSQIIDIENE